MQIHDSTLQRRQNALRALLLFTLPGALFFLSLNLQLGAYGLALCNAVLLFVTLGLLVVLGRRFSLEHLALTFLTLLYANLILLIAHPNIHPGAASWMTILPGLPYLLLRFRLAPYVATVALVLAVAAYFLGAQTAPFRYQNLLTIHVMAPMLALFLGSHVYARSRLRSDQRMFERAYQDPLTHLWNREKLLAEFEREHLRAQRTGMPLSLLLIDLDHFKVLNDRHGHDAGDAALVFFGNLLRERTRMTDLASRIGGEEFAVLLPDTAAAGAVTVAEDLRQSLEASNFQYRSERISITLSAGVAELGRDGDDWSQLYRTADTRLYACKAKGRNCVLSSSPA